MISREGQFVRSIQFLITNQWNLNAIPIYILMGGLAGLYSVLIIRQSIKINKQFLRISNKWIRVGIGGFLGYLITGTLNSTGFVELNVVNFTVVGMAGVLSGVIKIPLTAVFLIAEITGGYVLFVPLMIVTAISYFISSYFEHNSIYTKELEMRV